MISDTTMPLVMAIKFAKKSTIHMRILLIVLASIIARSNYPA